MDGEPNRETGDSRLDALRARLAAAEARPDESGEDGCWPRPGDVLRRPVVHVVPFGAFVEMGEDVQGLIRIPELSWDPIDHPTDVVAVGAEVTAVVVHVDRERRQVSLSRRALLPDPLRAFARANLGAVLADRVEREAPIGAFVRLGDGGTVGLVPAPEGAGLSVGDDVEVAVVGVNVEKRQVRLDLRGGPHDRADDPAP